MKVVWNGEFNIDNSFIDEQHKEIFHRINNLITAIDMGKGKEETRKILAFLSDYVMYHFEAEEKYMILNSYPGMDRQLIEHKKFKIELNNLKSEFEISDSSINIAIKIRDKLVEWLVDHIGKSDKDFAKFLKENQT